MSQPKRPRSNTRERILDAALELFVEVGFEGTTISDVERNVGLAAGTGSFYRHFKSKTELLLAVVEREVSTCMAEVEREHAALVLPEDPHEQMVAAATQALRDIRRFERLLRLMMAEGHRVPDLQRAIGTALYQSEGLGDWVDDSSRLVTIAALVGFHMFTLVGGTRAKAAADDDFIRRLVALIPPGRPPGVSEQVARRRRAPRT